MGSIPLPALDVDTPSTPNIMDQYQNLLKIQGMRQGVQQQQQLAPLQQQQAENDVQSSTIDLQQKQQAQKDQQATTAAMGEWDGKSYDDLAHLVLKAGGSGDAVNKVQQTAAQQRKQASEQAASDATTGAKNIETLKAKNDMIAGPLGVLVDPKQTPDAQLSQQILSAAQSLQQQGLLDAPHMQAAQQLAQTAQTNPAQARQGLDTMRKGLMANSQILAEAKDKSEIQERQGKVDPTSPLYSPSPQAVAMGTAPGSAQIVAGEAHDAGVKAGAEAAARQPYEMSLARQRQALSQGDPDAAGRLLVDGDATLQELKARGATPQFIEAALTSAHKLSGGKYNAQAAEAAFDVAKSPTQVAFFGSAKSLTDKGGTLDQLAAAGKDIPGGLIPAFNSVADWERAASGSGPIAKYASLALGVADDYSKVMGGGQGSDSSRLQALNLVGAKQSPAQRAASIDGIRGAVGSQTNSRIGSNSILKRMYGDSTASASSGSAGEPPASVVQSMKEGQYIHGPGGSYQKKNGTLVKVGGQ